MCGLVGFIGRCDDAARAALGEMARAIRHRGPDDGGELIDAQAGFAMAHRRLSIVDLSPLGHQPMLSESGRYAIAYNGEIYDFQELRAELMRADVCFRGHSDTEVLLAAIEAWGVERAVVRCTGMFAFALWDRQTQTLTLGRDRLGEKPLYYGRVGETFLFGSELKALAAHPDWRGEVDRDALTLLLRHDYVPGPHSIYQGIYKLPPGTLLTLPQGCRELPQPVPYWSLSRVTADGLSHPFHGSDTEATDELEALLRQAVRGQMVADVPLGMFLSGGIDSSLVAALMQAESSRPVKTFTIGFNEAGFDESPHALAVAQHLNTEHTAITVTPEQAREVIPKLPALYDEPFADVSQIPTYLLCQLARQHVTVALAGDGGDELFHGYSRYGIAEKAWQRWAPLPRVARSGAAGMLRTLSPERWDRLFRWAEPILSRFGSGAVGDKLYAVASILDAREPEAVYHRLLSRWSDPAALVPGAREHATVLTDPQRWGPCRKFSERMSYLDLLSYLPDDILVKVDRASMGVSLETREPLLDHRVVAFSRRLPMRYKVRNGGGKWLLRQVLYRHVPRELVDRPKAGFSVPIDRWLRGPLREWGEALLTTQRLSDYFDPQPIQKKWDEHQSGRRNWQDHLWSVLMFQAWLSDR